MQRNDKDQKHYSAEDITKIKALQDLRKRDISYKKTHDESGKALGEARAIDIKKKSAENLKNIKQRLRMGAYLPEQDLAKLKQEKAANAILTTREIPLFSALLDRRYILQHTTAASSLEKIQKSQTMRDPKELERMGIGSKQATPDFCGVEQNIFFGIGSEHSSLPKFVRTPTNFETDKPDDYATLQLDFNKLIAADAHVAQSIWGSGHFAHFLQSGLVSQVTEVDIPMMTLFVLAMTDRMQPVTLGDSVFVIRYMDKSPEQKAQDELAIENPLYRTQNKVFLFERNTSDSDDEDGVTIKLPLDIDDEVTAGGDILPFIAYSFIERLRLLGGSMQEYLLSHPDDDHAIDEVMEKFFRVDEFEVHIPSKLSLSPAFTKVVTPQLRKSMTEAVRNASAAGDIATLEQLLQRGYPLDGYMYEDPYHFDNSPATELPLIAAIKAGHLKTIQWLIENGAHRSAFGKMWHGVPRAVDSDDKFDALIIAALEAGNVNVFEYLLQQGLDINKEYKIQRTVAARRKAAREKSREELGFAEQKADKKYDSDDSDKYFLAALHALRKNDKLEILDAMLKHSDYARDNAVQQSRLISDAAGNMHSLLYLLAKFSQQEKYNFTDLFVKAAVNNNIDLMPALFAHANFVHLPKTQSVEELQKLRKKKLDQHFENGYVYHEIDAIDLHNFALDLLGEGCIEGAEWLLEKSYPIQSHEIGGIALHEKFSMGEDNKKDTLETRIKWLVTHAEADPCQPIKEYSFVDDKDRTTLLSLAMKKEQNDLVKWLLQTCKIDVETILFNGRSLLMEAVENDNLEIAEYFLSQGAKVPQDAKMLIHVVQQKQVKILKWLLAHGVKIENEEVVIEAMTEGNPEIMDILIANNAKLPAAEKATELFGKAIDKNNMDMLKWLEQRYTFVPSQFHDRVIAFFDLKSNSPMLILEELLHWLSDHGLKLEAVSKIILDKIFNNTGYVNGIQVGRLLYLKSHGIDMEPMLKDQRGLDMLMRAISTDNSLMGSLLGDDNTLKISGIGVPVNQIFKRDSTVSPFAPMTPLEYACSLGGKAKVVRELLAAGAKTDFIHKPHATALHFACGLPLGENHAFRFDRSEVPNTEVIKMLLAANAPVNIGEVSPLAVLCQQKVVRADALEAMLQSGANPDVKIPGKDLTVREFVARDYRELNGLIAPRNNLLAAPVRLFLTPVVHVHESEEVTLTLKR